MRLTPLAVALCLSALNAACDDSTAPNSASDATPPNRALPRDSAMLEPAPDAAPFIDATVSDATVSDATVSDAQPHRRRARGRCGLRLRPRHAGLLQRWPALPMRSR